MFCSECEALVMGFESHSAGGCHCRGRSVCLNQFALLGNMFPHFCRKSFLIVVNMGVKKALFGFMFGIDCFYMFLCFIRLGRDEGVEGVTHLRQIKLFVKTNLRPKQFLCGCGQEFSNI